MVAPSATKTDPSRVPSPADRARRPGRPGRSGQYGNISLSDGVIEFAKTHEEIKGAFLTFQKDADQIYPGWKEKLGYTGESSVQAASFDWAKKASAAAFVGASVAPVKKESSVSRKALDQSSRYADLSLDEATLVKRLSCRLEWLDAGLMRVAKHSKFLQADCEVHIMVLQGSKSP